MPQKFSNDASSEAIRREGMFPLPYFLSSKIAFERVPEKYCFVLFSSVWMIGLKFLLTVSHINSFEVRIPESTSIVLTTKTPLAVHSMYNSLEDPRVSPLYFWISWICESDFCVTKRCCGNVCIWYVYILKYWFTSFKIDCKIRLTLIVVHNCRSFVLSADFFFVFSAINLNIKCDIQTN